MEGDPIPPAAGEILETVTDDDLIAALLEAAIVNDSAVDGMTTMELVVATGRSDKWVRRHLWALRRAGRLAVGYGERQSLSGVTVFVPVYSIAKESPAD